MLTPNRNHPDGELASIGRTETAQVRWHEQCILQGIEFMAKLSEKEFWDSYWKGVTLPSQVDLGFSFERCLANYFSQQRCLSKRGSTLFEIGCAPGRWLAYFSKKFGLVVSGLDYSKLGIELTKKNLSMLGVDAHLSHADFFTFNGTEKYDIVASFGFIEHFEDPDEVVSKHIAYLKPGGFLILGIPNFRGLYAPVQRIYWKELLDKHNLSIMSPSYFHQLAPKLGLKLLDCKYIGGFEPSLLVKPPKMDLARNLFIRLPLSLLSRIRRLPYFDGVNSPLISSYIICIMQKPDLRCSNGRKKRK